MFFDPLNDRPGSLVNIKDTHPWLAMASSNVQRSVETRRPRSSQKVSVSWDDPDMSPDQPATGGGRLQFEVAECVETKTVTTTTTLKRSYPPMFVRNPRPLAALDTKEYPLAMKPTPAELSRFTLEYPDSDVDSSFEQDWSQQEWDQPHTTEAEPKAEPESNPGTPRTETDPFSDQTKPLLNSKIRKPKRLDSRIASPSLLASRRSSRAHASNLSYALSDKLRRATVTNGARRGADRVAGSPPASYLATPDATEAAPTHVDRASRPRSLHLPASSNSLDLDTSQSTCDTESPTEDEAHGLFGSAVATPPIVDGDADLVGSDADELFPSNGRPFSRPRGAPGSLALQDQDASLPSPRLSPTLAAAQLHSAHPNDEHDDDADEPVFSQSMIRRSQPQWLDDSQTTEEGDSQLVLREESPLRRHGSVRTSPAMPSIFETRTMLETFDAMPDEMKSFMMYQFLRRCPRKTLHMVAHVVNPALKCDFLRQLPTELSLHVLSYLDHRDLCRAAQVSKAWRSVVDSNETGWKELFDRDGYQLPPNELQRAITEGWGWQDPVGAEGSELNLSMQTRMTSTESELLRASNPTSKLRSSKRKRGFALTTADRAKRRASAQDIAREEKPLSGTGLHKSEGPMSAANAAVLAVPDPQLGIPSLRKLHLYKSLYRRHHLIRQNWTSGKIKPSHVAFPAHPRHVITCLQFDEDKIITGSDDTLIHVYDTKTGKLRKKLEGHEGGVWALQYDGNVLVSGSTDRSVRVWDIEKGICTQVFYGHTSTVRCLQILQPTPTGRVVDGRPVLMPPKPLIITGSRDSQLRVWRLPEPGSRRYIQTTAPANDAECPYFIRILAGHAHSVRAISAHADTLVSGSYDSTVRVWRISTGEQLHVLHGHSQKVYSVVLDHERNRCISGSMDSLVKIWDLTTGACLHTLEGHSLLVGLLDLKDNKLVSAAADSTLRIWDPDTGKCKSTLMAHTGAITCFQHDGAKVISGSEKTVKMWDINTGQCIQNLLTDLSGVWQVKFDDRRCVAAVQRDNLTYIEILDFGAVRDGMPPEELGKRILLNAQEVQALMEEEL